jgi:hypothetical protein
MKTSPHLVKRFELRCSLADYRRWGRRAKQLGLPSVATFVRIAANDAVAAPSVARPLAPKAEAE